ncbi:MICOS complex subunit Mic10-like [Dysidea avara]|uniref:MICOS complex subunit Mic10-like n=1 Tax=Dysidea avara TaxID=196820 RepID=UPI00331D6422
MLTKLRLISAATASEDELGLKWDRCVADLILKTGAGFGIGLVFSLMLRRRPWPVLVGTGFGLGYSSSNCQHDFKRVDSLFLRPVRSPSTPQEDTGNS